MSGPGRPHGLRLDEEAVAWRLVEGEVVALDQGGSEFLAVNLSGALLWEQLAAGTTRQALIDRLVAVYGIEAARATHDVAAFLEDLDRRGLLIHADAG